MESKLGGYFNTACFASPSIIGADDIGTTFGIAQTDSWTVPDKRSGILPSRRRSCSDGPLIGATLNFVSSFSMP